MFVWGHVLSEDLRRLEEVVERAVRRALAEARAEAVKILADYVGGLGYSFNSTLEDDVEYLVSDVNWIKLALGVTMEDYTAGPAFLDGLRKGGTNAMLRTVNPVAGDPGEVDVVCWNPLVVGEVATTLISIEEVERETRKLLDIIAYVEKVAGVKNNAKVLAAETTPKEVAEYLESRAREPEVTLVLGRR